MDGKEIHQLQASDRLWGEKGNGEGLSLYLSDSIPLKKDSKTWTLIFVESWKGVHGC